MKYLTERELTGVLADLKAGMSIQAVANDRGTSYQAIWYWKRFIGLDPQWVSYVRRLERLQRLLVKQQARTNVLLKIATQVIRQFEHKPRLRTLMATALRSTYALRRGEANRIMGVSYSAGSVKPVRVNNASLVREMKDYLKVNPGQGFQPMFAVLLRGRPNTRVQAMKLYREYALQMRYRRPRSLPRRVLHPMEIQGQADRVWSMDFMVAALPNGQRFAVLNGLDDYNREAMFTEVVGQSTTKVVLEALAASLARGRKPQVLRTDHGPEFTSKWYVAWTDRQGIARRYSRPGRPQENAFVESFNNTVRREVLNGFRFRSLDEVQRMLDDWRIRYNLARPHQSLGGLSPVQYSQSALLRHH